MMLRKLFSNQIGIDREGFLCLEHQPLFLLHVPIFQQGTVAELDVRVK